MQIIYARKATDKEVYDFRAFLYQKSLEEKETDLRSISENKDLLIKCYHDKENEYLDDDLSKRCLEQEAKYMKFNQLCLCGSKLKIINNSFWGCPNYLKGKREEHKNYMSWSDISFRSKVLDNYLVDIIRNNNLKGKLHAKSLLTFYLEQGLPDLKDKHTIKDSITSLDTFKRVGKIAKEFEERCVLMLQELYPSVLPQFPIKYKLVGEKDKFCFIDILCSNDTDVIIYECKTNEWNENSEQIKLYEELVSFIIKDKKINKKLSTKYLIQNG